MTIDPGVASLKIEGAAFVVTVDAERRIVRDGTVVVEGSRIARVGRASELAGVPADRVIDASGMVVTPGFINGHLHVSYAHAVRGLFPDDLPSPDYLAAVFALQGAMTDEEEFATSFLGITELLLGGTTCFLDPGSTKYLDACLDAYERSGVRAVLGKQVADRENPTNLPVSDTSDAVREVDRVIAAYDGRLEGRVRAWAMPFSADYASQDLLVEAKAVADSRGVGLTLHHANSDESVAYFAERYGRRPTEYLEDIGVVGPNVVLSHIIGLNAGEIGVMARTGTAGVMNPTAALKSGYGITSRGKLPELLEAGVTVGLGTDAGNNSNLIETLRSVYLAATLFKDARRSTATVPAEKALEMATIDGAAALGLVGEIGSVEAGKKADLVLFDTRRPEWRSLINPVNNLVYGADGRSVHTVVVDGRVVVEDHRPTFVDVGTLIEQVQHVGAGLLARTGVSYPSRWPLV